MGFAGQATGAFEADDCEPERVGTPGRQQGLSRPPHSRLNDEDAGGEI